MLVSPSRKVSIYLSVANHRSHLAFLHPINALRSNHLATEALKFAYNLDKVGLFRRMILRTKLMIRCQKSDL